MPRRGVDAGVEREAGAPSDLPPETPGPRGARGHVVFEGVPHSSGRAHLPIGASSAAAELAPGALGAVEGEPRVLVAFGIVRPERLPAAGADAAHARALGAREHVDVPIGGASVHRLMIIAHRDSRD
jgi:hypothetical protein